MNSKYSFNKCSEKIKKAIFIDIIAILFINLGFLILFINIDMLEKVHSISYRYEILELDEIIPLTFTLCISLLYFISRRLKELNQQLSEAQYFAERDTLTGLFNRRYVQRHYKLQQTELAKNNQPACLLLIDIDNFKKINDTFGHDIGDNILSKLAKVMLLSLKDTDIIARWGGEEFLIYCPNTTLAETEILTKRLQNNIHQHLFLNKYAITISVGLIELKTAETLEVATSKADNFLYQAKAAGKNRIISALSSSNLV